MSSGTRPFRAEVDCGADQRAVASRRLLRLGLANPCPGVGGSSSWAASSGRDAQYGRAAVSVARRADLSLAELCDVVDDLRRRRAVPEASAASLRASADALRRYSLESDAVDRHIPHADGTGLRAEIERAQRAVDLIEHGRQLMARSGHGWSGEGETAVKRGYLNLVHAREAIRARGDEMAGRRGSYQSQETSKAAAYPLNALSGRRETETQPATRCRGRGGRRRQRAVISSVRGVVTRTEVGPMRCPRCGERETAGRGLARPGRGQHPPAPRMRDLRSPLHDLRTHRGAAPDRGQARWSARNSTARARVGLSQSSDSPPATRGRRRTGRRSDRGSVAGGRRHRGRLVGGRQNGDGQAARPRPDWPISASASVYQSFEDTKR